MVVVTNVACVQVHTCSSNRRNGRGISNCKEENGIRNAAFKSDCDRLYNGLKDIEETYVNGSMEHRLDSNFKY